MKRVAVAISIGVFAISLSLPGILFAQDSESEEPQAEQQTAVPDSPVPDSPEASAEQTTAEPQPARGSGPKARGDSADAGAPTRSKQGGDSEAKASATVSMVDNDFQPATVTVSVGDDVTWRNDGQLDHTATGSNFSTGTVSPGDSASETFSTPGSYSYLCDFHPDMKGTVKVEGTGAAGNESGGTDPGADTTPTTTTTPTDTTPTTSSASTGTSSSLPATGQDELPLTIVGLALLGVGAFTLSLARWLELWDGP